MDPYSQFSIKHEFLSCVARHRWQNYSSALTADLNFIGLGYSCPSAMVSRAMTMDEILVPPQSSRPSWSVLCSLCIVRISNSGTSNNAMKQKQSTFQMAELVLGALSTAGPGTFGVTGWSICMTCLICLCACMSHYGVTQGVHTCTLLECSELDSQEGHYMWDRPKNENRHDS